jgi:hypothetical protein
MSIPGLVSFHPEDVASSYVVPAVRVSPAGASKLKFQLPPFQRPSFGKATAPQTRSGFPPAKIFESDGVCDQVLFIPM